MNQVAKFISGSFITVNEGLWRDVSGDYFVGGEMFLPTERVQQMDTAGELEWLSGEGLEVLATAASAPVLAPVPEERTSEIVAEDAGQASPSAEQKKSPWPWIAACVALLVVGVVTVVFILNQPQPVEQATEVLAVEQLAEAESEQLPLVEIEPEMTQENDGWDEERWYVVGFVGYGAEDAADTEIWLREDNPWPFQNVDSIMLAAINNHERFFGEIFAEDYYFVYGEFASREDMMEFADQDLAIHALFLGVLELDAYFGYVLEENIIDELY